MGAGLFDLTGRVAVITGAASGIPKAMAFGFAAAGAHVVVADLDEKGMDAVVSSLSEQGRRVIAVPTNVSNEEHAARLAAEAIRVFGKIDVLVNAAGFRVRKPVLETSRQEFEQVLEVNLTATFLCSKHVGKVMVEQKRGSIINIASIHGHVAGSSNAEYAAAKGGVVLLTKGMAIEWAPFNVRVNALCPGVTRTPGTRTAWENPERLAEIVAKTPMKRIAEPEEMVGPAIFLASDASSFVTGSSLIVDGGWTAW